MTQPGYLDVNRRVAAGLLGRRMRSVLRLVNLERDEPARTQWGPALVELDNGTFCLFDCEESKSNVILFELPKDGGPFRDKLSRLTIRPAIATADPSDPLRFMLESSIVTIEEVSREDENNAIGWYVMSGLRLTFERGDRVVIGTELTDEGYPSTGFYLPHEVDRDLRYIRLAS